MDSIAFVKHTHDLASITPRDILVTSAAAIAVAIVLKVFVLGAFMIPSHSMENTLLPGDYIMVNKLASWMATIERGDVIVFRLPDSINVAGASGTPFIKRVVGIGGDTVRLSSTGVFVNGWRVPEPPQSASAYALSHDPLSTTITVVVPEGYFYVLGDNRANSWDSRYWGCLPGDCLEGLPLMVYYSYGTSTADSVPHIRWERILERIR